jgi:hypothetical protein
MNYSVTGCHFRFNFMNHSVQKIQETVSVVHYQICKIKLLRKESHSIIIKKFKVYIKKKNSTSSVLQENISDTSSTWKS